MKIFYTFLMLFSTPLVAQQILLPLTYSKAYNDPAFMVLEADSITAVLEHVETADRFTVFDLEIVNKSGFPVHVDPRQFHYYAGDNPFPELTSEDQDIHQVSYPNSLVPGYMRKTIDKLAMEKHYETQLKQQQALAVFFGVLSVGMVVLDVSQDIKDVQKEVYTMKDWNRSQTRDALVASTLITRDVVLSTSAEKRYNAGESLHYLNKEFLEAIELPDTSAVRGNVYFPKTGHYKYYRIVVPVDGINFVFDFRKGKPSELRYSY